MRPIRTLKSNFTYLGPKPEVADLPVHRDGKGKVLAVFALADDDRAMIANGAQVQVGIWQEPMPPISICVVKEEEAFGEASSKDYRCALCEGLYIEKRAIALEYKCGWCGGELQLPDAARDA